MNWTLELDVEVEGKATKGDPGDYWQPPDPPEVELYHVWIGEGKGRVDVIDALDQSDLETLEEAFLDQWSDGYDDGPYDTLEEKRGER